MWMIKIKKEINKESGAHMNYERTAQKILNAEGTGAGGKQDSQWDEPRVTS